VTWACDLLCDLPITRLHEDVTAAVILTLLLKSLVTAVIAEMVGISRPTIR